MACPCRAAAVPGWSHLRAAALILALLCVSAVPYAAADASEATETSVCGRFKEPLVFWLWSRAAGSPDPPAARRVPNAEAVVHRTRDGRLLRGYRIKAAADDGVVRGTLLVAQGNAMLADQLLPSLSLFSTAGMDTWIFDYRGYGGSAGKPRLRAILEDYVELYERVFAGATGARFLYGISFGGIVQLNLIGSGAAFDRAVIDSTPSRGSLFGCPVKYDPVENLPRDSSRLLFVGGHRDTVVPLHDSRELFDRARERGARIDVRAEFAHPFMDADSAIHQQRLGLIRRFLAGGVPQPATLQDGPNRGDLLPLAR